MTVKLSEEALSKTKQIMAEVLQIDESQLINSAEFIADLGADSLDIVELTMALEEEFAIEIPDQEVDSLKTVGEALACLEKHLG